MLEWRKVHELPRGQEGENTEIQNDEYRRITDVWNRKFQKSVGIVIILDAYDSFEVRRCEEVFGITDVLKSASNISANWEGGLSFSVSTNINVSTDLFDGRIVGIYETREDAVEQAESYIQSQS